MKSYKYLYLAIQQIIFTMDTLKDFKNSDLINDLIFRLIGLPFRSEETVIAVQKGNIFI